MGACTFTVADGSDGHAANVYTADGKRGVEGTLALSASYATNGDTLALTKLGLSQVDRLEIIGDTANVSGYSLVLGGTASAPKVKAYVSASTEETATTDLHLVTARVRVIGS